MLSASFNNDSLKLLNYDIYRKDRDRKDEGVLIGVQKTFKTQIIPYNGPNEFLAVDVFQHHKKTSKDYQHLQPEFSKCKQI